MTRRCAYGGEAADGRVSDPAAAWYPARFTRRARLEAENLLLRQQLVVLRGKSPTRVRLWNIYRLLLVWLYRLYSSLLDAIIIVQPESALHSLYPPGDSSIVIFRSMPANSWRVR
jgi:hypothetical protein